ncbi:twitch domain-containing radical SAM protein [Streptomyces albireticuli]|nr:twitch domain-containing radical SAM protein [Streptomyces albireticuli]MCD9195284.1 twitch domain-containing radical SAM protein [Streptomyces albireticuli]
MGQKAEKRTPLCVAPFVSIATWADGESIICCEDKGPEAGRLGLVSSMSELVNSEKMRTARKQFMRGEVPEGCRTCLDEATRQPTVHNYYQDKFRWQDVADAYDETTGNVSRTQYLLIALSNLCTYSCRMCFDKLSTRLNSDRHRMLGVEPIGYRRNDIDKVIDFIRANPIRIVTFHGGNPINEPRLLDVLNELSDDVSVEIISNGSTLSSGKTDIRPHLSRFERVHFNISLDGTRRTTEYVRVHSDFDNVFRHFNEVKALPNTTVNLHNTITNLNLFDLPSYYAMTLSGEFADADSISSYIATTPAVHRVSTLPPELRRLARERIEDFLRELDSVGEVTSEDAFGVKVIGARAYARNVLRRIDSVPYSPHLFARFLDLTRRTDAFYGVEPLPEYSSYFTTGATGSTGAAGFTAASDSSSPPRSQVTPPPTSQPAAPGAVAAKGVVVSHYSLELAEAPYGLAGPCPYTGERRFQVSECRFSWTAAYRQNCTAVTVRIQLNPDAGITAAEMATLRNTWETGIENKWSNRFVCTGPYGSSVITFDVQWVTSSPHHVVRVRRGPAQSDMTTWDTADNGDTAAHEFGHMLGNPDEYLDSSCPNRNPVSTGTVMDNETGPALQRHVNRICVSAPLTAEVFSIGLDLI